MKRSFGILQTIEMTEKQNNDLNLLIKTVENTDKKEEIVGIYISRVDIAKDVLNKTYCPIILFSSESIPDNVYASVKEKTNIIPEYINREEFLPTRYITVWSRQ